MFDPKAYYEKLQKALKCIRSRTDFVPEIALILGSGLGEFADNPEVKIETTISYSNIEGFPVSTVPGHAGRFVFAHVSGVPVVMMQGRVHYYEGYEMQDVVLPTRLMGLMGAKVLFLTNAAGATNPDFEINDLMMITGQIADFAPSPLRGPNIPELGLRFPDMSGLYEESLCNDIRRASDETGVKIREGVYVMLPGPNFESAAEVKMCGLLGGSAVGMSTACEAIAGRHMGMKVCGISLLTNMGAGLSAVAQSHTEVNENAALAEEKYTKLIKQCLINIHKYTLKNEY